MLRLAIERKKRGWTQFELARLTNIHPSDLSQLERGLKYPYPGWKKSLVKALNVPADELFKEAIENE